MQPFKATRSVTRGAIKVGDKEMSQDLELEGVVEKDLGDGNYRVEADANGKRLLVDCRKSGKMRRYKITVAAGDKVKIILPPPYDKGRITFREKN